MLSHSAFYEEDFESAKKIGVTGYRAPKHIWLDGDKLLWEAEDSGGSKIVQPKVKMFEDFMNLRDDDATREDVLNYAKRWGVLGLCKEHGWPSSHDSKCSPRKFGTGGGVFGEPLSTWLILAQVGAAILEISQKLDDGELGDKADWESMLSLVRWPDALQMDWHKPGHKWTSAGRIKAQLTEKTAIASLVNHWIKWGGVRPHALWFNNEKGLRVSLLTPGLFSALAVQLLEMTGRYVLAACSECRKFYHPKRRPKASQNRYCPDCDAAGIPLLRASQWRNQRKQQSAKARKR